MNNCRQDLDYVVASIEYILQLMLRIAPFWDAVQLTSHRRS